MIGFHISALTVEEVAVVVLLLSLCVGQKFLQTTGRLEQRLYQ